LSAKVDLHMHTMASDGTWTLDQVLEEVYNKNINIFSITDHDTVEYSEKMKEKKLNGNCFFIPGVEIASTYKDREYHLTVYNYNKNDELLNLLKFNDESRLNYNYEFIDLMSKEYKGISLDDYFNNYREDPSKGGWKALNYFIDKKIFKDIGGYFHKLKDSGLKLVFKNPEEVVEIVQRAGGKIFLAHPSYYYRNSCMPKNELDYWKSVGLDGIECYTPYAMGDFQTKYYKNYCVENNLMISGGSDCHGDYLDRSIGVPDINLEQLSIDQLLDETGKKMNFKK